MNWIITSSIMFLSSIVYYLIIKKAQINKIESKLYMVANFLIPLILFFVLNNIQKQNLFINYKLLFLIFLNAVIFSYFGSVTSYWALEEAPNAGYSLTIQKSYTVYTSIASVFLFNSTLSISKFIAIIIIVISTAFVLIGKNNKKFKNKNKWIIYSFLAFFLFGTLRLNNRLIISQGVAPITQLFWNMFFVFLISLIDLIRNKKLIKTKFNFENLLVLFGVGVSVTCFYYFLQISELIGPNLGFVSAINTASNAFYTVLVALIFKDELSWKKFLAIIGVTAGLILLIV